MLQLMKYMKIDENKYVMEKEKFCENLSPLTYILYVNSLETSDVYICSLL